MKINFRALVYMRLLYFAGILAGWHGKSNGKGLGRENGDASFSNIVRLQSKMSSFTSRLVSTSARSLSEDVATQEIDTKHIFYDDTINVERLNVRLRKIICSLTVWWRHFILVVIANIEI